MNRENILQRISYRKPMVVHSGVIYKNKSFYAKCPKCNQTIEREFQSYCDGCGQCLDWCKFDNINIFDLSQI
jgi:ferredoxin